MHHMHHNMNLAMIYVSTVLCFTPTILTGMGTRPHLRPPKLIDFIRCQAQSAKYVLSVCTGSWLLADAGILDGKRATSNKLSFKRVKVSLHADKVASALV